MRAGGASAVLPLLFVLFANFLLAPFTAGGAGGGVVYAQQQPGPGMSNIIDANYSGPIFQDAFWTDRTSPPPSGTSLEKIEVGPGEGSSVLAVVLANRGLSEITAITGRLTLPADFKAAGSGGGSTAVATYNNIVKPGEVFMLFFEVEVLESAKVQGYSGSLEIEYSRVLEVGEFRSAILAVPFRLTGKVILDAQATQELVPGSANEVGISISNIGSVAATGVVVTVMSGGGGEGLGAEAAAGSQSGGTTLQQAAIANIGPRTFEVGTIPPDKSVEIRPTIYASSSAGETAQTITLQVSYGNAYGVKKTVSIPVGLVILPRALESDLNVTPGENPSTVITAGKIYDYKFVVSNIAGKPLTDVLITLKSQSDLLKILGDSRWTIKNMDAGFRQEFSTQVFAPTEMIGSPATLSLSMRYLSSPSGQAKTESIDLGAYVDGEINIRAYDIAINYIGGTPNIVGNLLNEGNTVALFTTIELTNAGSLVTSLPPQQYLGDLSENSPLPFSIPIDVSSGEAAEGTYPVSLRVTYKDSLRELHTLDINSEVSFEPEQATASGTGQQEQTAMNVDMIVLAGIAAAATAGAAIAAVVMIRRRRRRTALRRTIEEKKQDDFESLLNSHRGQQHQQQQQQRQPDERK